MIFNTICPYCRASSLKLTHEKRFHPFNKKYGPFNYGTCQNCGALVTSPMPSKETLAEFYSSSVDGMPEELRLAREKFPQDFIYKNYVKIVSRYLPNATAFKWLDIGAGGGEFASFFSTQYPEAEGHCVDFHEKPKLLQRSQVKWHRRDLNESFDLGMKFDLITSFAVFEHMLSPDTFFNNLKQLSHEDTRIVLVFPKYDSLLAKLLGEKWPYFIPGEHLTVPTTKSLNELIPRYFKKFKISSTTMPYSLKYCLSYLNMDGVTKIMPLDLNLPVPSGLFLITINV